MTTKLDTSFSEEISFQKNIHPEPLENTDPDIALFLLNMIHSGQNNTHNKNKFPIRGMYATPAGVSLKHNPIIQNKKTGRNDSCLCEANKKFKNCCGK